VPVSRSAARGEPRKVPVVSNATALVLTFGSHATVLTDSGVSAWGLNTEAQLGHAPNTNGDLTCGTSYCNPNPKPVSLP
jgi:hypothetical protein